MKVRNPTRLLRPILATLLPLAAFILQWMLWPYLQPYVWFLFYPAVFFSSWIGGLPGGLVATLISAMLVMYFFMPPQFSFAVEYPKSFLSAGVFGAMGVLFGYTQERLKQANRDTVQALAATRSANDQLETRVRERTAELVQTNELLQASEARYRSTLENMLEGGQIIGYDWRYLFVNDSAARQGRRTKEELLGHTMMECYPGIENTDLFAALRRCMDEREPHHMLNEFTYPDGSSGWFELSIQPAPDGIFILSNDITERKRVEEALRESETRLKRAQRIAHIGSWELNLQTNDLKWSDEIYRMFEIETQAFRATYEAFLDAVHPNDRDMVNQAYTESLKNRTPYEIVHRLLMKDGSIKFVQERCETWYDENGQPIRSTGTVQDITERERAEEEIRRLNAELEQRVVERTAQLEAANKELEAFSYSVSHDLRAPLRSIDGFSQALLEDYAGQLDAEGRDYLQRVRASAQHMARLIDDLLNLARVARAGMKHEPVNLSELAQAVAAELEQSHPGRRAEFHVASGLVADGDQRLLRLVLENLLSNAWKFTSRTPAARIEFGAAEREGRPAYYVRDNGVGFDMAYASKLFGAFQRLHPVRDFPGTGIGLATVQRIIHRHGGQVWAEGQTGQGATFYFTL